VLTKEDKIALVVKGDDTAALKLWPSWKEGGEHACDCMA
jgi:hypothetical protein